MTKRIISFGAIVAILALPLAAYAQPSGGAISTSPAASMATGSGAAAPAAPGGTVSAAPGLALSADQNTKVHQYVMNEKKPSVKLTEKLAVGTVLPHNVELYPLPADMGVNGDYRYGVVNDRTVLVEAKTHKVTQIIE
jgi:hypothetical protein